MAMRLADYPLPYATFGPLDEDNACPFRCVDRWPHHYRVYGNRWNATMARVENADLPVDTEADAKLAASTLERLGYRCVGYSAPSCTGDHADHDFAPYRGAAR